MKKRVLAALMTAMILLTCALPASAEAASVIIPLPSSLASAGFEDGFVDDDGVLNIYYTDAAEEDVVYYLTLCTVYGTYYKLMPGTEVPIYCLCAPGAGVVGEVQFAEEEGVIAVFVDYVDGIAADEDLEPMLEILTMELELPANAAGNIAPQFFAVANRQPYFQSSTASSALFDNQLHWTEMYDEIDAQTLQFYATYMVMLGYEAQADAYVSRPEDNMEIIRLYFNNGDAEIYVDYNAADGGATVHYEPGISYFLLDGAQMNDIFGE